MQDCKPIATPMDVNVKLTIDMCPKTQEDIPIPPVLRKSTRKKHPPKRYGYTEEEVQANITFLEEPQTYQEAMQQDVADK